MNLDDYISGYVDGDLTPEEDAELRALIAGNPLAKEEFENAALISASILHDAENINVPDDVFEETGLLLSAAFRESVPQNATAAHSVHGRYRIAKKYVAVLALILVYVVSDVQRLNYNDVYSVFYKSNFSSIQLPDIQIESPRTTLPRVIGQQHRNSNSNVFTVADSQVHIDNAVTDGLKNEIASATQSQIPTVNITADTNTGLPPTAVIPLSLPMSLQSAPTYAAMPEQPVTQPSPSKKQQSVILSSYLSNGVYSSISGANGSAVQGVSHSIGFPVTTHDNIGLEVGVTSYSSIAVNSVPMPSVVSSGTSSGGKKGGVLSDESQIGGSSDAPQFGGVARMIDKNLFWGAAFYERSLLSAKVFNVSSRLGVGSSADGPLLYGRSFARIDVSKVFSLTVGAEGRMFLTGEGSQATAKSTVQTMLSGIYGLQVRF